MNTIVSSFAVEFSSVCHVTFNGAYSLLLFLQSLLTKEDIKYSDELTKVLITFVHYLNYRPIYYHKKAKEVHDLVKSLNGYDSK